MGENQQKLDEGFRPAKNGVGADTIYRRIRKPGIKLGRSYAAKQGSTLDRKGTDAQLRSLAVRANKNCQCDLTFDAILVNDPAGDLRRAESKAAGPTEKSPVHDTEGDERDAGPETHRGSGWG